MGGVLERGLLIFLVLGFIGLLDLLVKIVDKIGVVRPQGWLLNSLSNNKKARNFRFSLSVPPQGLDCATCSRQSCARY